MWVQSLGWEDSLEKEIETPFQYFLGFPCGSTSKESVWDVGDLVSIPELGRPPGEGKGYPLQYSGLENTVDYIVHGVSKSWTRQSDFLFTSSVSVCVYVYIYMYIYIYTWFCGFPGGSAAKESACNTRDLSLILGLERSPGEGNGNPL